MVWRCLIRGVCSHLKAFLRLEEAPPRVAVSGLANQGQLSAGSLNQIGISTELLYRANDPSEGKVAAAVPHA